MRLLSIIGSIIYLKCKNIRFEWHWWCVVLVCRLPQLLIILAAASATTSAALAHLINNNRPRPHESSLNDSDVCRPLCYFVLELGYPSGVWSWVRALRRYGHQKSCATWPICLAKAINGSAREPIRSFCCALTPKSQIQLTHANEFRLSQQQVCVCVESGRPMDVMIMMPPGTVTLVAEPRAPL